MEPQELEQLKYPIGKFKKPENVTSQFIKDCIKTIDEFPAKVDEATNGLTEQQLRWIYRPEGWSIRQLVHHCADSHMNSFIRFKLTLTEDLPTIKPYHEDLWATMPDYLEVDTQSSISILKGLHHRWVVLLGVLSADDLMREFVHPEHGRKVSVSTNIGLYAWHCQHHLEHIYLAMKHKGVFN